MQGFPLMASVIARSERCAMPRRRAPNFDASSSVLSADIGRSVRQALYQYFATHQYVEIERYTKWDGRNAYFIPKGDLPKFLARDSHP